MSAVIPTQEDSGNALVTMMRAMQQATLVLQKAVAQVEVTVADKLTAFQDQVQAEVLAPIQQRMSAIEAKQRDSILIDPQQQEQLREAIADKAKEFDGARVHYRRMYGRLHREFGIPKYGYLRAVDFEQAMRYIRAYDGARTTWTVK